MDCLPDVKRLSCRRNCLCTHRDLKAVLAQEFLVIMRTVVAAAVCMMNAAPGRLPEPNSHPLTGRALQSNLPRGFKARMARSRFIRLLTAQPIARLESEVCHDLTDVV